MTQSDNIGQIETRIQAVRRQIADAARKAGRRPEQTQLLAVSKTHPASYIRAAWAAGQRTFGESYVQEAVAKIAELSDLAIEWHFIGRVQSNKTRAIAEHFDWLHSLGNAQHAERLNDQRPPGLSPLQVCVQVNLSEESSKGGIGSNDLQELATRVAKLPNLNLRGLMTMPDPDAPRDRQIADFKRLRDLLGELRASGHATADTLSMGMTNDLEDAIAAGSTLVRIGTAIFGKRS